MDRALWLLGWLRLVGWLRRIGRSLTTVRGALLVVVGALVFLPWVLSPLLVDAPPTRDLEPVQRWGPLVLAGYCLLNLLLASEGALTFSPAEVNFLFPGPLGRRQLLGYKLLSVVSGGLLTAVLMALFLRHLTSNLLAGLLGLFLTTLFLQLLPMALALVASSIGARAYNRQRKIVLLLVALAVVIALVPHLGELTGRDRERALAELEQSPIVQTLLAPFGWFVQAFTAEQLWPDLLQYLGLSLLVNVVLVGLIFLLDAHYLEASATASERVYARLERLRRGGPAALSLGNPGKARLAVPALPWWGGIGPIVWRQLVTLARSLLALVTVMVLAVVFALPPVMAESGGPDTGPILALTLIGLMALFISPLLPFDFRGDLDRLEVLKTLPLAPWRIALGQVVVPALVLTLVQLLMLGGLQLYWGKGEPLLLAAMAFGPVLNLLLVLLDNLLFLWFPTRQPTAATPGDLQTMGRQMVLWMAKMVALAGMLFFAFLFGAAAFVLGGQSVVVGGITGWVVLAGCVVGLVPLLALAFRRFDVSRDMP
ncbi:MAG: putative ABC exporter domain-containing protein [Gemmataceae bacterium]|nr:putative ABC exporter domain-containing protein [Gemmataceae bacterium]